MPTIRKTAEKIAELAQRPAGWRYGQGKAASEVAVDSARRLNWYAASLGYVYSNAFLAEDGGLQFVVYEDPGKGDIEYEFNTEPNGLIDFACLVNGQDRDYQEGLSFSAAIAKLEECALCNTYDLFTQTITTPKNGAFAAWPSLRQQMGFQSLPESAPKLRVANSAPTYTGFIPTTSAARPRYSG